MERKSSQRSVRRIGRPHHANELSCDVVKISPEDKCAMEQDLKRYTRSGGMPRRAAAFVGAVVAALLFMTVFVLSYLAALRVTLPFSNPDGIVGTLTAIQFNPHTNVVRFLIITISPTLALVVAFFLFPGYLHSRLFRPPFREMAADTLSPTRRWVLVPLLVLTTVLVALDSASYMASGAFDTFEEGQPLSAGMSYLSGGTPYRDFIFIHGLYDEPLRAALAFTVFGPSIGGVRTLQSINKIITFGLLAWFLFRAFRGKIVYAFALLFAFHQLRPEGRHVLSGVGMWEVHPIFIVPRDTMLFAFLVALTYLSDRIRNDGRSDRLFWLAAVWSVLPGLGYIHSMERGIFLLLAFSVIAPGCYLLFFRGGPQARPFILGCFVGLGSSFLLLAVLIEGAFGDLVRLMSLLASDNVQLQFGHPYPFGTLPYVAISVMMAFNCFWLAREFLIRCRHTEGLVPALRDFLRAHLVEVSLLLISMLFYKNALGRADWVHVAYVLPAPVILFALILLRHILPQFLSGAGAGMAAGLRVAVVAAFWLLVAGWNVRLAGSILREGAVQQNFPLGVEDAHYLPERWKRLVPFLRSTLSSSESFYTLSDELSLYYFVGKPCPVRFSMLDMVVKDERLQRGIIADLEAGDVKYVVYDPSSYYYQIDGFSNELRAPLVFEYVNAHYRRYREIDGQVILIRNDPEAP